jgi:PBP1b-binding outer membrane lipoprotein LpoB
MKKIISILSISILLISCVSTRSTLKNVDDSAPDLVVNEDNTFVIREFSTDKKYGYDKDYPINIFYKTCKKI